MSIFDAQVERLVELGYPQRTGCDAAAFRRGLDALRAHVPPDAAGPDLEAGTVACLVVVGGASVHVGETLPLVVRRGRQAVERLYPRAPGFFRPVPAVRLPAGDAYLLLDVDRGNASLNMTPVEADRRIADAGRSPLTIEEGVALLLQYPEFLQPNRCFMSLGSRGDDKRVPAFWLSAGRPKLGWCWEGNPHTWLGFASCRGRSPGADLRTDPRQVSQ
jgi:hypothetical protein